MNKNLLKTLHKQNISHAEKLFLLEIYSCDKEPDGFFHLHQPDWAEKLHTSTRQIKRYLKNLSELSLIKRDYRPCCQSDSEAINGAGGKRLFIKVNSIETEDNMTFIGTFTKIDERVFPQYTLRLAMFKDVYNLNNTIRLSHAFSDLKHDDYNSKALANIEIDDFVVFNGSVRRTEQKISLSKIWNIKSWRDYEREMEHGHD